MMNVRREFDARAAEVALYFKFLRELDGRRTASSETHIDPSKLTSEEQAALLKTLKANGFLLLYNLIEATSKNAIEAIFDELRSQGVSFDDCRKEVKKIALTNLKRHDVDKILPSLSSISVDVVVKTSIRKRLFDGNVDAKRLRKVARNYGFRKPVRESNELLTVKSARNDLAHGEKSFSDVGRDYDVARMEKIRAEVVAFLSELLDNVDDYITSRSYLASPSS